LSKLRSCQRRGTRRRRPSSGAGGVASSNRDLGAPDLVDVDADYVALAEALEALPSPQSLASPPLVGPLRDTGPGFLDLLRPPRLPHGPSSDSDTIGAGARGARMRARAEFTVEPFVDGKPGAHVHAAIEAVRNTGLEPQIGPFATVVDGETSAVIFAMSMMLDAAQAAGSDRVSLQIDFLD
jgi:uncharacterized protein YqgV (UPF0045/DUF77 family)